jgi:fumarate reductase subunit D
MDRELDRDDGWGLSAQGTLLVMAVLHWVLVWVVGGLLPFGFLSTAKRRERR